MSNVCNAGDLRHRVIHQSYSVSQDSYKQAQPTYTSVATYWGFVEPLSGRKLVVAQEIKPEVTHQVTLRFWGVGDALKARDRFLFGSRVLNVESVLNVDERNHTQIALCTEVVE